MLKKIILIYLCALSVIHAQNEIDALRYSISGNENTAGISALGGTGGLLSHSYNPASLSFFKGNNMFSLSLGNRSNYVEAEFKNELNIEEHATPFIQNAGYVTSLMFSEQNTWSPLNIALSVNRKQNFNQNIRISGNNFDSSIINQFIQNAQSTSPENLDWNEWLAYETYLINPVYESSPSSDTMIFTGNYSSAINTIGQNQTKKISENGFVNEVDLALSSSYKDILFLGGSIGFTHIKFTHRSSYTEDDFHEDNNITNLEYNEYLFQEGGGVNLKFGAIIKPLSFIRLGWSYHSPTYNEMSEFYEASIETNFEQVPEENANFTNTQSYSSNYNFLLNTPSKSITSLALIGKHKKLRGLLAFDLERINYGSAKLAGMSYYDYDFYAENQEIIDNYGTTNNVKLGVFVSLDNISIRGGYAMFGSPFQASEDNTWSREYSSLGFGYKVGAYSFDIAISQKIQNEDYILYDDYSLTAPSQGALLNSNTNTIIITCSYKL